jgi:hypothetical protein
MPDAQKAGLSHVVIANNAGVSEFRDRVDQLYHRLREKSEKKGESA